MAARHPARRVDRLTLVVGIVNVTPDSFSDDGHDVDVDAAVAHGARLVAEGADWLDVGGESTRPGAAPVASDAERARVVPVIAALAARFPTTPISVDTTKADVAAASLAAGARIVNDVSAWRDPAMAAVVAGAGAATVLMHMRGEPRTMQADVRYGDLVGEVVASLAQAAERAVAAGLPKSSVWLDPGIGFGKAPGDNPRLFHAIPRLAALGHPVLVGASRKRFIGELTGVAAPAGRVFGSVGAALAAVRLGATAVRVHDVAATRQALAVYETIAMAAP